jgi:hypothetical protein
VRDIPCLDCLSWAPAIRSKLLAQYLVGASNVTQLVKAAIRTTSRHAQIAQLGNLFTVEHALPAMKTVIGVVDRPEKIVLRVHQP